MIPQKLKWIDSLDIAIELYEKFPETDPQYIRFTDLSTYWATIIVIAFPVIKSFFNIFHLVFFFGTRPKQARGQDKQNYFFHRKLAFY